ncbi:MAG: flagellar hook basal-body protein [Bacteroidetes bacterium]|nr:flagellar hook basal-body protein [Bacteroidota bacterium]
MLQRIRNSAAAMTAIMRRQEVTANNLANVNTSGFRKERVFEEMLGASVDADGFPGSDHLLSTWIDTTPGTFAFTERSLDVVIAGGGYFEVEDPETGGLFYTRAGQFNLDADGQLTDASGRTVLGESGPIAVPADVDDVRISQSGEVRSGNQVFGKIRVVEFAPDTAMKRIPGAAFDVGEAEPVDVPDVMLKAGYVESSNVNVLSEMTDMIEQSRMFEAQQRSLRTLDQTLERAIRDLGQY